MCAWVLLLLAGAVPYASAEKTIIYLERSATLSMDEKRLPGAQILQGDVCFRHDSIWMYCDSAFFYQKSNSLDAFGHVRFVQGDTLTGFCERCHYEGNTRTAKMREHVRLIHRETVLTTDSLDYNRESERAYYWTGGTIRDSLNTLTSVYGQYAPPGKQAEFRGQVLLENDRFTLASDTLLYNTESHLAQLVSPTEIVYQQETTILSSRGEYNTETEVSVLLNRSVISHRDGKHMTGDTICYDKALGWGQLRGHLLIVDSVRKCTLSGDYAMMYEATDYHLSWGLVTDSALLYDWSDDEYPLYVHADTLYMWEKAFAPEDSLPEDSTYRVVQAYHHARVYRKDVQAVADSIVMITRDSVMKMIGAPICWHDTLQMSADSMIFYAKDGALDYIHGMGNALVVRQTQDSAFFDQLSGKEMLAYVVDSTLEHVEVNGNAESIFYPVDEEDNSFVGMNRTESSYIRIFFRDGQLHHILFTSQTSGTLYPLSQIPSGRDRLPGFMWADMLRPKTAEEVFDVK